ncbi:hypothetical protein J7L36_02405 [bacterium]|nr:hypothetical protein [bacterium]
MSVKPKKICPKCGHKNDAENSHCEKCGWSLKAKNKKDD